MQYLSCDRDFIYLAGADGELNRNLAFCPGEIKEISDTEFNARGFALDAEDYQVLMWDCIGLAVIVFGCLVVKKALN